MTDYSLIWGVVISQLFIEGNQLNAAYCFVSLSCIFCCYLSMALVFLPKIMYVRKHSHDPREKEDDERETALQELQYRELLKANEELQRKVAEVSFALHSFLKSQRQLYLPSTERATFEPLEEKIGRKERGRDAEKRPGGGRRCRGG